MRIHELLHAHLGGVRDLVDGTDERVDLRDELRLPESVRYTRSGLDEARTLDLGPGSLVLSLLGPTPPTHSDPDALAPVLRQLQPGARAVLALGWPIEELPYHRLVGPLVDGRCQILEAAPVERVSAPGVQSALIVQRVSRLAPLRSYLTDLRTEPDPNAEPDAGATDELRTVLRVANEYVFVDLISRPLRRRLIELNRLLSERDAQLRAAEWQLARSEARIATLKASASFQVGRAVLDGIRHPARAVITVPRDLTRVWRVRRSNKHRGPSPVPVPAAGASGPTPTPGPR